MDRNVNKLLLFAVSILFSFQGLAQNYILNGSATQNNCNCYTLTTADKTDQSGSVWNKNKIDLHQPFDFWFNVYLGSMDANGADGIVFILQRFNTSVGRNGSGLGFDGVTPSIGIALDTWQNNDLSGSNALNDPAYDHISIQANGVVQHGNDLAGPVPISATSDNVEDGKWHKLRISWDPATRWLRAYFDEVLRVEAQVDLVNDIFKNDAQVYWGFSAATGGSTNLQQFCTALNPDFKTDLPTTGTCPGVPVAFSDQSVSFAPIASYYWNFGDGTSSTLPTPLPHTYATPGHYEVQMVIKGFDGCASDTLVKTLTVGSIPKADFKIFDTCFKKEPRLRFAAANIGTSDQWFLNNSPLSALSLAGQPAGAYSLRRVTTSDFGCGWDEAVQNFTIKSTPVVSALVADGCTNVPLPMKAAQSDDKTTIQRWFWTIDNAQQATVQNPSFTFRQPGPYVASLWAEATNGCRSDTLSTSFHIGEARAFAGQDTLVLNSVPFQLNGWGNGRFQWSPATGLNRDDIANPVSVLTGDQEYELTVTTAEGCVARDRVRIEVFKGSAIYVPTAFSPDGNGQNDLLKPRYVGIQSLSFFTVYNRWGQVVFTTSDSTKGWDGRWKGALLESGSFIWMLKARDYAGKEYQLKGVTTLIR